MEQLRPAAFTLIRTNIMLCYWFLTKGLMGVWSDGALGLASADWRVVSEWMSESSWKLQGDSSEDQTAVSVTEIFRRLVLAALWLWDPKEFKKKKDFHFSTKLNIADKKPGEKCLKNNVLPIHQSFTHISNFNRNHSSHKTYNTSHDFLILNDNVLLQAAFRIYSPLIHSLLMFLHLFMWAEC